MRVLVTGGRDYKERYHLYTMLDELHARTPITEVIHGACPYGGADIFAEDWAKLHEIPYQGVPARFTSEGKAAGPRRNQRMIDSYKPDFVVAFPGGRGTDDMMRRTLAASIMNLDLRDLGNP